MLSAAVDAEGDALADGAHGCLATEQSAAADLHDGGLHLDGLRAEFGESLLAAQATAQLLLVCR